VKGYLDRRVFLKGLGAASMAAAASPLLLARSAGPNVLFIAIDDLNDWIGCLGGHPDVKTPHLDRLAAGGVLFSNAHCPAPLCNPSRAALMTGVRPSASGVYENEQDWRESRPLKQAVTIPMYFKAHGYRALTSGKIFHNRFPHLQSWDECWPSADNPVPRGPKSPETPFNGIPNAAHFDWGPLDVRPEDMGDWQVADWTVKQLQKKHDKPFFLACGFSKPHLPWYVPRRYFDLYPLERITLPTVKEDDLDDVPPIGRKIARQNADHANVLQYGQWRKAVQGYLAAITFVDDCVGRVLDGFEKSEYRNNTVLVLWSDHGWHLGEKLHWRKFSLWEEATRNILVFRAPGMLPEGKTCTRPVNLQDMYPTLVNLCGLPARQLEAYDLTLLLNKPNAEWKTPTLTTYRFNNHSVRSEDWRYIRYSDGTEELYDHRSDPMEWTNIAGKAEFRSKCEELAKWLPKNNAAPDPAPERRSGTTDDD